MSLAVETHALRKVYPPAGGAPFASNFGLFLDVAITPQQIGVMFSLIITPMIFFGCAYYPWSGLAVVPWLQYLVLTVIITALAIDRVLARALG